MISIPIALGGAFALFIVLPLWAYTMSRAITSAYFRSRAEVHAFIAESRKGTP